MAAATGLRLKLLIDTKSRRVVFAEAGKDVVDFLFSLLALPLATAVALVGPGSVPGSAGGLYASVHRLDDSYVLPGADKGALLFPAVAASPAAIAGRALLLPVPPSRTFYKCGNTSVYGYGYGSYGGHCTRYVTDASGAACPSCRGPMTTPLEPLEFVSPSPSPAGTGTRPGDGFVQGVVTYTVTDDLTVTPMSSISSIMLLNAFAVTDVTALQEATVQLGYREGVEILRASLQSKTVLTDVFLGQNSSRRA